MRERWFGATGRRVPAIVLQGSIDVEGALLVDGVDTSNARSAHAGAHRSSSGRGRRGVSTGARAGGRVVLVSDPALLEADLPELTLWLRPPIDLA
jgi:hypothetical protein